MNTLLKALIALAPACILFAGSAVLFSRGKTAGSFLQLLGAACLTIVVLNRSGQRSIRINEQWRICFVWHNEAGNASDVEIVDYH